MDSTPDTYALQDARKQLSDIISKALFANQASVITRSGKKAAVVISYQDYLRYRELEDQADGELATARLSAGGKRYTADEVKAELEGGS